MLEPLARASVPVTAWASWSGLVAQVADPACRLAVIDPELKDLDPELLAALAASLPHKPELRSYGATCGPLQGLSHRRLVGTATRHTTARVGTEERRELRLLGLGRDTFSRMAELATGTVPVLFIGERGTGKKRLARNVHTLAGQGGPLVVVGAELPPLGGDPGMLWLEELERRSPAELSAIVASAREAGWQLAGGSRRDLKLAGWRRAELQPLRARQDELRALTLLYLDRYRRRLGLPRRSLDRALWALIRAYRWPGNARELEAFVVQAITATRSTVIRAAELPEAVRSLVEPRPHAALLERSQGYEELVEGVFQAMVETLEPDSEVRLHKLVVGATERALLRVVLARTGGNQKAAATLMGVARNTLRSKALDLGLLEPSRRRARR